MTDPTPAPLVVTDDDLLLADLVRLAAAAGVTPDVARECAPALRSWSSAPVVLVGADRAADLARSRPPRRGRVHVVGRGPLADDLFRHALAVGAETVAGLPTSESWLVELLTDVGDGAGSPGVTVGVVGGAGGVGATVFAAALAQVCATAGGTLVVDADVLGAGIDRVLGLEEVDGIRWDALMQATGRLSARSLREALPRRDRLSVLTWPVDRTPTLQAFAMREALSAGRRGFATVVVDVPRHPDPVVDEVLTRCDHVLLVTTLTVPAVTAAARVARRLPSGPGTSLVLRGAAAGVAPREVSRLLGLPVVATMGDQRGLDEAISLGVGPLRSPRGTLARAARQAAAVVTASRQASAA
ncbi:MAG: septum site determining protein [Propionibacteriales bacterium]|nr:septum site determining protein [Propionibacteriales bacterium]